MIPIFRAKKIDSTEYVKGFFDGKIKNDERIFNYSMKGKHPKVDISTLSIHFPDMLDSQGNKIFASLQEDGKGGDILKGTKYEYVLSFDGIKFNLQRPFSQTDFNDFDKWEKFKIIGIQQ